MNAAPPNTAPTLSSQLRWTAQCVLAVEQGRSLNDALPRVPAPLRPGVQALTFAVLRHWGAARAVGRQLVQRSPAPAAAALLHSALALLLEDAQDQRYATHTLVDQVVEAAKASRATQAQAGFLNACLRRFLREREALCAGLDGDPVARWNHPLWWIERLQRDHPEHWMNMLAANQRPGPMTLRVHRRVVSRDDYRRQLLQAGLLSEPVGEDGLVLATPQPVDRLPGFARGQCSVQDAAAQLAAGLLLQGLGRIQGARVLDACAAPGGKTAHLLECADVDLLALDVDAVRCERIRENLQRLDLQAEVRCADAAEPASWWDGRPFDAILLDAPCTASGIVRRHPDVRWLRRPDDVQRLAAVQRRLLQVLWPLLKPGGRLVYCTCSVFKAEGAEQVQAFLADHDDARLQPSPGHLRPGACPSGEFPDNVPGGYDGFFYACIDKNAA
ncbi:MAG: 16S rRNA (cytosine(967)-C(5))-methyltransferase RsmB [Hydrogenophaga sp.]